MPEPEPSPSFLRTSSLEQAFKQFSLETERLQSIYQQLQERFKTIHTALQELHTRLAGKFVELDFTSNYLTTILSHISQGIIFIDLNGIVTTYNPAAQQLLHIPEQDLLFHPFTRFLPDRFFGFSLQEVLTSQQCPSLTYVSWNDQNERRELEIEATFVAMSPQSYPLAHHHASPPIQGLLVLLRDVTKLQRLQQTVHRHDRLKELGELAAHLAHEIRNPLGGIKGFATLLQRELHERPDLQQMAAAIVQGTDDLNHFVSQMLIYARPFQPHVEKVELVAFIEDIRQLMVADVAWSPHIHFTIHSSTSTLFTFIDPQLFRSALINLFVNAVQAMPEGGTLSVTLKSDSTWIILSIEDTGKGITPENLSKIFSPFFTTKQAGNGLGLVEVHKIVRAHQGWIDVQSEVGRGTVFTIKIPIEP